MMKSVIDYKKTTFYIVVVAAIVCIAIAVCFLNSPKKSEMPEEMASEAITETLTEVITEAREESADSKDSGVSLLQGEELSEYLAALPDEPKKLVEAGVSIISFDKCYGMNHFFDFLAAYDSGQSSAVTIGQYTVEGDLILSHISYDGEKIVLTDDYRRDVFADSSMLLTTREYKYFSIFECSVSENGVMFDMVAYDDPKLNHEKFHKIMASSQIMSEEEIKFAFMGRFTAVSGEEIF